MKTLIAAAAFLWCGTAAAQPATPATYTITVNADGSFSPQTLHVRDGDTVQWVNLARTDSVIPVDGADYPDLCQNRRAWHADDLNDLTGPLPVAPSGVYTLSPLDDGLVEGPPCPPRTRVLITGDNGKVLCGGGGALGATLDSTWQHPDATGVFIRLLWRDVNPAPGVYDFTVLQREVEKAVRNGKVYSLGIKAGNDGTPDWIFTTNADDSARADGGGGIPRLHFQDTGDNRNPANCGVSMDLGNPTRPEYYTLYGTMLVEVANLLKSRADWYRALGYIKISGANLYSHENRLPNDCLILGTGARQVQCACSPKTLAADGYRPSSLYAFYDKQMELLQFLFPGKVMSYALIQDGFPRINEKGAYINASGASSDGSALPGAFEQMQTIMDNGQETYGVNFAVQHNGIGPKPAGCNFDGVHPKPLRPLDGYWDVGSGCPNRWAVREGAQNSITGFQTVNLAGVGNARELDSTFQNTLDNSDGVFLEIYEELFWLAENTNQGILPVSGKTIGGWAEELHKRRNDARFPNFVAAKNPFPTSFSRKIKRTTAGADPQTLYYVHGMKCGGGNNEWGAVIIDP